ncbi:Nucleoside-diphosphate-sugar epimerase [Apiospora arundinis]|uniref:Nucleoside-diphosphate-sugar epimerase n=1 Tax=Apiospora arundinis TaxID=335852 RepID=A0ABR2HT01_9PEZI
MSYTIKNVAIAGAGGNLGKVVTPSLVSTGKFNIRVLTRQGSSTANLPKGVEVVEVDYTSPESLQAALAGQDAVISLITTPAAMTQLALIDAAIAAGVKRFIPSEFGSNLANAKTRANPVFKHKVQTEDYLVEKAASTSLTYTFFYNNAFLDWALRANFIVDFTQSKPQVLDGGDTPFSATTMQTVADGLAGVLLHPEETKNRAVYVHDLVTSQNKLLDLARQARPDRTWEPESVALDDLVAVAEKRMAQGIFDFETIGPFLKRAIADPECGGVFTGQDDNELLGLKGKTDEYILELLKDHLK